ncbi:YeeE/YedE thiosulfate transporter family protein [Nitratifractor salsuginis]|uniref:Uncharacterized protein n=1 Tax=Nitratifractor salsuginis (strain DSM 16511 / JCM 12458 / E9I37-1) TaxID=749222 RepID=E6WZ90_NITSE|nr:YeeE/YedE thiosulfate transporter family protein [Nitratifractor salsuginis]ADV46602.1 protein of unknown function DUF395 YeeE/YedE [Nitratifractor salsuginis DSM 16511]
MNDLILPLYKNGFLTPEANFFFAIVMGFAFGFVLERTGFTRAQHIADTFYFRNLAVPKIMGVTVITATTWFILFAWMGWIDLNALFTPSTYVWPYVVGGIIFGFGMVMSGYCPGTAVAGLGSGKSDALVFLLGLFGGAFIYFLLYPLISGFVSSGNLGVLKLHDLFGGNEYTSYILTVALETGIIGFLMLLQTLTNKGEK